MSFRFAQHHTRKPPGVYRALARHSYLASVAVIPAGITSSPSEYTRRISRIRWIDRSRLHEPVVARLDAWVRVENACVASNVCGAKKQGRNIWDLIANHR